MELTDHCSNEFSKAALSAESSSFFQLNPIDKNIAAQRMVDSLEHIRLNRICFTETDQVSHVYKCLNLRNHSMATVALARVTENMALVASKTFWFRR